MLLCLPIYKRFPTEPGSDSSSMRNKQIGDSSENKHAFSFDDADSPEEIT